ncbi:MAG TPA: FAD-binding oxidoreductase [Aquaticitalea sp.]|nr:FAD-binding oxidoreductase [Aquaticitalea sp.]HNU59110.1 FAD-binding oxidoreductase [Aquaticitalea sp.]
MELDYIIVGCGLAGIAFCEQLRQHGKTFVVFDDTSQIATKVAGGVYNPVVLKRFTEVWRAQEQLDLAKPFYKNLEALLDTRLNHEFPVLRRIASIEEQNQWAVASDRPNLKKHLHPTLIKNDNKNIVAPFGFGKVLNAGKVDTKKLVSHYIAYLNNRGSFVGIHFNYSELESSGQGHHYGPYHAKCVVFAEGFGMKQNPFFNDLPLVGVKGEILTVRAPELRLSHAIKSSVFVIPEGNDIYTVGATYDWDDKTNTVTDKASEQLSKQLKELIICDFEIIDQAAGVRPTVKDRRPLVGIHGSQKNIAILNGLGTRGVMVAPMVAKQLFEMLEYGTPLDDEINIDRFRKL